MHTCSQSQEIDDKLVSYQYITDILTILSIFQGFFSPTNNWWSILYQPLPIYDISLIFRQNILTSSSMLLTLTQTQYSLKVERQHNEAI